MQTPEFANFEWNHYGEAEAGEVQGPASTAADDGNVVEAPFTPNSRFRPGDTPGVSYELKRRRIGDGASGSAAAQRDVGSLRGGSQCGQWFCGNVVCADELAQAQGMWSRRFAEEMMNRRKFLWQRLNCLLYTSPSPRDLSTSRMPSSA